MLDAEASWSWGGSDKVDFCGLLARQPSLFVCSRPVKDLISKTKVNSTRGNPRMTSGLHVYANKYTCTSEHTCTTFTHTYTHYNIWCKSFELNVFLWAMQMTAPSFPTIYVVTRAPLKTISEGHSNVTSLAVCTVSWINHGTDGIGLEFFHRAGLANSHEIRSLGKCPRAGSILRILT